LDVRDQEAAVAVVVRVRWEVTALIAVIAVVERASEIDIREAVLLKLTPEILAPASAVSDGVAEWPDPDRGSESETNDESKHRLK
jgi:hypothetical protein